MVDVDLRKYITIAPVVMEDLPDAHNVFLQVTNQRFCVTPYACDSREGAEWFADQLYVALVKIVSAAVEAEREACAKIAENKVQGPRAAATIRARKP
jgi:hypothetical protein